ncbi:hypothetical protein [Thiomicrorhabdus xiamenensis]|uniref:Uncharacterized protein n=1 Tax=Thiomicrorhabdus xiamenensis TaxID=2739063 RepID=A0A7D4NLY9_9GAMM|nr:hypothetical protein [Thiomicrorhabdus xiamenensis]QKI89694.1 hypothetical protein HQN79_08995 [Thiomicrorhabdus xiamenensis]
MAQKKMATDAKAAYKQTAEQETNSQPLPDPNELLDRLQAVDCEQYDVDKLAELYKGQKVWYSALAIPVSTLVLTVFTLIGAFVFDQPIISFIVAAALLYWIASMIDGQQKHIPLQARNEVIQRIAATEGEHGLVPHFKDFLPKRYRHLWQSLRKGNYIYIDQYVQAVMLLQKQIERDKFIKFWYLKYPHTAPEAEEEEHPFADIIRNQNPS